MTSSLNLPSSSRSPTPRDPTDTTWHEAIPRDMKPMSRDKMSVFSTARLLDHVISSVTCIRHVPLMGACPDLDLRWRWCHCSTVYMIKCVVNNVSRHDRLFVGGLYTYLCGILFYLDGLSNEPWYSNIHIPFQIPKQIIEILWSATMPGREVFSHSRHYSLQACE